jgi:hypothetical protein
MIRTSTKQRGRNKMDLTIYKQMPDLPNADIMFISELEDMVGYELEGYEAEENMQIERDRIDNDMDLWDSERIAEFERAMDYKSKCGVWP